MTVLQTLEAMEAELHQDVYRELHAVWNYSLVAGDDGEGAYLDVRLQVSDEGSWTLHTGDASYDQDHTGHWGAGTVSPDDDDVILMETARDLVEQVLDSAANQEEHDAENAYLDSRAWDAD